MKKILIPMLLLSAMAYRCGSSKSAKTDMLEGKVVRVSCASFVVQVTNNDTIGEDGWKDMMNNDKTYDNVFAAGNKCKVPGEIKAGSTIRFKVNEPAQNDCIQCMMFDGPPKAKYDITDVTVVGK